MEHNGHSFIIVKRNEVGSYFDYTDDYMSEIHKSLGNYFKETDEIDLQYAISEIKGLIACSLNADKILPAPPAWEDDMFYIEWRTDLYGRPMYYPTVFSTPVERIAAGERGLFFNSYQIACDTAGMILPLLMANIEGAKINQFLMFGERLKYWEGLYKKD